MGAKRFYRFAYLSADRHGKEPRPHQLRDGDPCLQLAGFLHQSGFEFGNLLLNYPASPKTIDEAMFHPGDLIVLTTRPPMDDPLAPGTKHIVPSGNNLERRLFAAIRPFIEYSSRYRVKLSSEMAALLDEHDEDRAEIQFRVNKRAWYTKLRSAEGASWLDFSPGVRATCGYMIYLDRAWQGGPGLLAAFGMSGPDTLAWTYLLRTRLSGLLQPQRFAMVEMQARIRPPSKPTDLSYVDRWRTHVLLSHDLMTSRDSPTDSPCWRAETARPENSDTRQPL